MIDDVKFDRPLCFKLILLIAKAEVLLLFHNSVEYLLDKAAL